MLEDRSVLQNWLVRGSMPNFQLPLVSQLFSALAPTDSSWTMPDVQLLQASVQQALKDYPPLANMYLAWGTYDFCYAGESGRAFVICQGDDSGQPWGEYGVWFPDGSGGVTATPRKERLWKPEAPEARLKEERRKRLRQALQKFTPQEAADEVRAWLKERGAVLIAVETTSG